MGNTAEIAFPHTIIINIDITINIMNHFRLPHHIFKQPLKVTGKVIHYSKYQNQQIMNVHLRKDKIGVGGNARGN